MARMTYQRCVQLMGVAMAMAAAGNPQWLRVQQEASAYFSRGKGRGTPSRRYGNTPHADGPKQGERERARRRAQMQRGLISNSYRG